MSEIGLNKEISISADTNCLFCGELIYFSQYVLNDKTKKPLPLNSQDSTFHKCKRRGANSQ